MTRRGVSPVVGFALLVGLTALVAVGVFVVASTALDTTTNAAQQEQTQASMQAFADTTQGLTSGQSSTDDVQIEGYDGGSTVVNESAGRLEVTIVGNGTPDTVSYELGVLRYRTPSGTVLAYQGGGVWKTANGHVETVRAPQFNYGTDPRSNASSLTLPLTTIRGNATETGSFDGEVSVRDRNVSFPDRGRVGPIRGDYLEIAIESEYAAGWEEYIRGETPAVIDESHDAGERGRVVANFSIVDINTTTTGESPSPSPTPSPPDPDPPTFTPINLDGAVNGPDLEMGAGNSSVIRGDVKVDHLDRDSNASRIEGNRSVWNGSMPTFRDEIEEIRNESTVEERGVLDQSMSPGTEYINSSGVYEYESVSRTQYNLTVTADDPVVIIVENDFDVAHPGNFIVSGAGNVTVYVGGDFWQGAATTTFGNSSDPAQVQVKAAGDLLVTGNAHYHSVLSAPHGTVEVEGNSVIEGAILAQETVVDAGTVEYHPVQQRSAVPPSPPVTPSPPAPSPSPEPAENTTKSFEGPGVGYLHVSETEIQVDD